MVWPLITMSGECHQLSGWLELVQQRWHLRFIYREEMGRRPGGPLNKFCSLFSKCIVFLYVYGFSREKSRSFVPWVLLREAWPVGELPAWAHRGQQNGVVPYPLSLLVPRCFATGQRGASLRVAVPGTALLEPCLEPLTLPVTSAAVSAGLISATAIRRTPGSETGTSFGGSTKGGALSCFSREFALPPLLLLQPGTMGRQPEPSCSPARAGHVPATVLPVSAVGGTGSSALGCNSRGTKGRCCSILLLPILSISQLASNSLPQWLGPCQGCGSLQPTPSPGFLLSQRDGKGHLLSKATSFLPLLCMALHPVWDLSLPAATTSHLACTGSALPCLSRGAFSPVCCWQQDPGKGEEGWEGEGAGSSAGSGEFADSPP